MKKKRKVMAKKTAHQRPNAPKPLVKEVCAECGYSAVVRGMKCPMCVACPRCGRKLMHCTCIEGE